MSSPAADTRPVVWLGSAGTGTAFGLAKTLREHWGDRVGIAAADIHAPHLVATSVLADRFVQVPMSADPAFLGALLAGLSLTKTTHYQPLLDEEILLAATARDEGRLRDIVVFSPSLHGAHLALDKYLGAAWMAEHGIPTPPTTLLGDARWQGTPLFSKPRFGRGSVGAKPIDDEAAFAALHHDLVDPPGRAAGGSADAESTIVQPRCEGPELTVDAVHLGGITRAVARERLEVKSGVCTKARVFEDDTLEALAHQLALGLGLNAAFCFQVMRLDGRYVVTDLNARPGAGTRLTVAAGVDVLGAAFAYHFGEPFAHLVPRLPHERFVVRQYAEYVTR